jgi:hypothetical protein
MRSEDRGFWDLMAFDPFSVVHGVVRDHIFAMREEPDDLILLILALSIRLDNAWERLRPEDWEPEPASEEKPEWPLLSIRPWCPDMDEMRLRAYRDTRGTLSSITRPPAICDRGPLEDEQENSSDDCNRDLHDWSGSNDEQLAKRLNPT